MAGKWKMAKAFGRAVFGKNNKENPAAKMARDVYDRDLHNYTKDKDAAGRAEAFNRGNEEAWMDERSIVRGKDGRPDVKLESKDVVEARGDARLDDELRQDFEKAFDDALSDRVKRQSEAEGRTKSADIKTLNDDLRQSAIEMLHDPNSSIADVLDILKRYDD